MADETLAPPSPDEQSEAASSAWWPALALVAGFAGAWMLPGTRPGIGLLIVGVFCIVAVVLGADDLSFHGLFYWGPCVVLIGSAVFLAAEWVITLNLLAAFGLALIRSTESRTWRALFFAPFRVLGSTFAGIRGLAEPLVRRIDEGRVADIGPAARGALLGTILVLIFGALFVSADAAFSSLLQRALLPNWDMQLIPFRFFLFVIIVLSIATLVATGRNREGRADWNKELESDRPHRRFIEWGLPLAMLDALFLVFVAIQVTVLFGGRSIVLETAGLTYAEYARQGFFQLLTVAALTIAVISFAVYLGNPTPDKDRTFMRGLLGVLCVLTLVILASAYMRLSLYEEAFGFTRLRLTVHAAILWLAVLFGLILVAGIRWSSSWMPQTVVLLTTGWVVAFSLINPDHLIATRNVDRFERTGKLDRHYLGRLSEDALPVLVGLPEPERACVLGMMDARRNLRSPEPWNAWNVSRARARDLLEASDFPQLDRRCFDSGYGY